MNEKSPSMKVVAGIYRHRLLKMPPQSTTRPSSVRLREGLFNVLTHTFSLFKFPLCVLDAFAGSGALGIEALSRGASWVQFCEKDPYVLRLIEENLLSLNETKYQLSRDFFAYLEKPSLVVFDLVLLDPPYGRICLDEMFQKMRFHPSFHDSTLFVLETSKKDMPEKIVGFSKDLEKVYGACALSFWTKDATLSS